MFGTPCCCGDVRRPGCGAMWRLYSYQLSAVRQLVSPGKIICGKHSRENVMLTLLVVVLTLSHSASHPSVSSDRTSLGSNSFAWSFPQLHKHQLKRVVGRSALCIHHVDHPPEGVPSSLFTFSPKLYSSLKIAETGDNHEDGGYTPGSATVGTLEIGPVEDSDLDDVSDLLVEAFPADMILKGGEFSDIENVLIGAPLDMTNRYLRGIAYFEVLYALKSRCGERLARGDFALTSEALVMAVRDSASSARRSGTSGRIIAVVELTLRQPNGSLPTNWPFPAPWRRVDPVKRWEPYMCNLAVEKSYRGKGLGRQLVRLCEHVAKNHWGYKRMYLHVDLDDPAAMGLYSSMGYESITQYDTPVWIRRLLGMPTIRYQVKQLRFQRRATRLLS